MTRKEYPKRKKVFIGAAVHPASQDEKKTLAERIQIIEDKIKAAGYEFHAHPLKDLRVFAGHRPPANEVVLAGMTMQQRIDGVPKPLLIRLKKIRDNSADQYFDRDVALGLYIHECLRSSLAGIFDLTLNSPGSHNEIGILRQANVPLLILSDKGKFSTTITGDPSPAVSIRLYKDNKHIGEIVSAFLQGLKELKVEAQTVRLKKINIERIRSEAVYRHADFSATLDAIIEQHFGSGEE